MVMKLWHEFKDSTLAESNRSLGPFDILINDPWQHIGEIKDVKGEKDDGTQFLDG
jgi:hypothetical protein